MQRRRNIQGLIGSKLNIADCVLLDNGNWFRNGRQITRMHHETPSADWFKSCYRALEMNYPKFFKMDSLSKLAVLAAETLLGKEAGFDGAKTGVCLFNAHSSLISDQQHQLLISDFDNFLPSPAVFVYTLPNIMLGEICIRYRITGENFCGISADFNPKEAQLQVDAMFKSGMEEVLLGWVDFSADQSSAWMARIKKPANAPNNSQISTRNCNEHVNIPKWKH